MQNTDAKTALQEQQQQQRQRKSEFRSSSQTKKSAKNEVNGAEFRQIHGATWNSAIDADNLADTPPLPSPKKPEKALVAQPPVPQPTLPLKNQILDLDQRASPLSSNEAQQVRKEMEKMLQTPTKTQISAQSSKPAQAAQTSQQPPLTQAPPLANLQVGHIRLEDAAVRSAQAIPKKTEEIPVTLPRANSDNAIAKQSGLASEDLLGDEEPDDELEDDDSNE